MKTTTKNVNTTKKQTTVTSTAKKTRKAKVVTKKAQAIKIVTRMTNRKKVPARKVIIAEMMEKGDMSANCAATYYQNVKSGLWG